MRQNCGCYSLELKQNGIQCHRALIESPDLRQRAGKKKDGRESGGGTENRVL